MKKLLLALAVVAIVLPIRSTHAMDFSKVKVVVSREINKDCGVEADRDPVWGCYLPKPTPGDTSPAPVNIDYVYLRDGLPGPLVTYVYLYQMGQYALRTTTSVTADEIKASFHPPTGVENTPALAANNFVTYVLGGYVTPAQRSLWQRVLSSP